jgi:hypothetical protein
MPTPVPGTFDIFAADKINAAVKFTGSNAKGPQIVMNLVNVMFRPNNPIGVIQDEWGQLHITGEVLADATGSFGTITHPDTGMISPLTDLYYVGKGNVEIQLIGDITYRHIGNVPTFEFVPAVTTLPHYSSMVGVRVKDDEIIHEKAASLNIVMDEWSYDNMKIAFLGLDSTIGTLSSAGTVAAK